MAFVVGPLTEAEDDIMSDADEEVDGGGGDSSSESEDDHGDDVDGDKTPIMSQRYSESNFE